MRPSDREWGGLLEAGVLIAALSAMAMIAYLIFA
jgi:hypothetical protein